MHQLALARLAIVRPNVMIIPPEQMLLNVGGVSIPPLGCSTSFAKYFVRVMERFPLLAHIKGRG